MPNPNQNLRRAPPQHITENRTYRNIVATGRNIKFEHICALQDSTLPPFILAAVLRTQSNGGGWVGRLDAGEESGDVNVHVDEDYCQETPWQYSKVMEQRD